ncbi:reverse transcriptase domain-containing protein [Thiocapsa imhoffii]|nr:reverse transcriptase domain-containing protein [Thiocapsa imhoffii]
MAYLFDKVCTFDVLNLAWQSIRKNKGQWTPKLSIQEVETELDWHFESIIRELQSGHYRPYSLNCFDVPKSCGGRRLVCAPYARDKLIQRAVILVLEPIAEQFFHPASFGYRPLCTIDMALSRVREWVRQGYIWLGDTDITACFDSIPQDPVLNLVDLLSDDSRLTNLFALWFETLPLRHRYRGDRIGLPQGLVVSPLLCNLYLHDLDMDLEEAGIPFVRYADNFMVMAGDEEGAYTALEFAANSVARLGLELNGEKTCVLKSRSSYRFLGKRLPTARARILL